MMKKQSLVFIIGIIILLVFCSSSLSRAEEEDQDDNINNNNVISLESPLDLPPLPQHVSHWSVEDVEKWMTISIGYPEFIEIIQTNLIDGPTLLLLDVDSVFGFSTSTSSKTTSKNTNNKKKTPVVQLAKLKAHQQLLRGQCICNNNGDGSSSSSSGNTNFYSYLDYSSRSTMFHLALAAISPRIGFISSYFLDSNLMCCTFGSSFFVSSNKGGGDVDKNNLNSLIEMYVGRSSSSSSSSLEENENSELDTKKVATTVLKTPCGSFSSSSSFSSTCSNVPGIILTISMFLFPYAILALQILGAFSAHPFFAILWIISMTTLQVVEILNYVEYILNYRNGIVTETPLQFIKSQIVTNFKDIYTLVVPPVFFVIGWFLPFWMSYLCLIAITVFNLMIVVKFALNILGAFFQGFNKAAEHDQHEHAN